MSNKYLIWIIGIFCSCTLHAQDVSSFQKRNQSRKAITDISSSLEQNLPADSVAVNFEIAARTFLSQGDYNRAEDYFQRAKQLYNSLGNPEKVFLLQREIAKINEQQKQIPEAIENYRLAGQSKDPEFSLLNLNDAKRLENISDPQKTVTFIQSNIQLLNQSGQEEERSQAYRQMAHANVQMNNTGEALENLQFALKEVKADPVQSTQVKREIAFVLSEDNQVEKAIDINREILAEARQEQDSKLQIEQLQALSTNYVQTSEADKAIESLKEAYTIAVKEGHTLEAKESVLLLAEQYQKQRKSQKALDLYAEFLSELEPLVKKDSTLIDERFFQAHEERIAHMEKERELQDELIRKQYTFNNILLIFIFLIFLSLLFIVKALYAIKKKNKKIALQSLRREMNPHFIFNSLNSVNHFIAQNNEIEANRYLSSYSRLMRNMMEHSNQDFIPLSTEIDQLQKYLELEYMRFPEKFTYRIEIDESLDTDALTIPNMLIQPQLENAVWHGLRYLENGGTLTLSFQKEENALKVIIEDNGIGLEKSKELKTEHQKSRQSRGQMNTSERINLLNSLYNCHIRMDIEDKTGDSTGVIVRFYFPLQIKKQ